MKLKLLMLLFCFIIWGYGCKEEPIDNETSELTGIWIRMDKPTDTLVWRFGGSDRIFELKRGYELVGDHRLPVSPAGLYTFSIENDSISIHSMLSSSSYSPKYFFSRNDSRLRIGNFIDQNDIILTFKRIQ